MPECGSQDRSRRGGVSPRGVFAGLGGAAARRGALGLGPPPRRVVAVGLRPPPALRVPVAAGCCPIAPGTPDPLRAIGRTNDAVLYGARVALWARCEDRAVEEVIDRLPSSSSKDHGRLFHDLFREHGGDFYKIDPMLFSPAQITVVNASTGRLYSAGAVDETMLRKSFGID